MNIRHRSIWLAAGSILLVWLIAGIGYTIAQNSKMTSEKVQAYLAKINLRQLSGEKRNQALRDLAAKINSLSPEERRRFRAGRMMEDWFEEMSEQEKGEFLEAIMPSGFKQMINAFEKLPEEKRKKTMDEAMKRLKERRESDAPPPKAKGTNQPALSEDLQKKVTTIGLKSFYSQSSAQTKAELAPLMEEIQKNMESGRMFR